MTDSKVMLQSGAKQDKNLRGAASTTFRGSEHLSLGTWRPSEGHMPVPLPRLKEGQASHTPDTLNPDDLA